MLLSDILINKNQVKFSLVVHRFISAMMTVAINGDTKDVDFNKGFLWNLKDLATKVQL